MGWKSRLQSYKTMVTKFRSCCVFAESQIGEVLECVSSNLFCFFADSRTLIGQFGSG